jgi:hypothetical protein
MVYPLPTRGLDTIRQMVYLLPQGFIQVVCPLLEDHQQTSGVSPIKGPDISRLVVYILPEVQVQQAGAVESPTRGLVKENQVAYPLPGEHQIYKHASAASPSRGPDVSL